MNTPGKNAQNRENKLTPIIFRCDGSTDIGLGHIVGSIRLAELLAKHLPVDIHFITRADTAGLDLISTTGYTVSAIDKEMDPVNDLTNIATIAGQVEAQIVVVNFCKHDLDCYSNYWDIVKNNQLKLVFMDNPVPPSYHKADLLINALPHPDYDGYNPRVHPRCFDGLEYFIPPDAQLSSRPHRAEVQRVLVAMGGSDASNVTSRVLEALIEAQYRGYVDVVVGRSYPYKESLNQRFESSGLDGDISVQVSDLMTRMTLADIGYTALGLTTYEMGYVGLPGFVLASTRFNANVAREYCRKYQAANYLGYYEDVSIGTVASTFCELAHSADRRKGMSDNKIKIASSIDNIPMMFRDLIN